MSERMNHADLIKAWVDRNEAALRGLEYGEITFVFSGRNPARVKVSTANRLDADDEENGV